MRPVMAKRRCPGSVYSASGFAGSGVAFPADRPERRRGQEYGKRNYQSLHTSKLNGSRGLRLAAPTDGRRALMSGGFRGSKRSLLIWLSAAVVLFSEAFQGPTKSYFGDGGFRSERTLRTIAA